jgi:DNA-binding XRE family transcriptional regulator
MSQPAHNRRTQQPSRTLAGYRIAAGLTQIELAELADVYRGTISNAERGRVPLLPAQRRIAAVLSTRLEQPISHMDLWPFDDELEPALA